MEKLRENKKGLTSLHIRILAIAGMLAYFIFSIKADGIYNKTAANCMQWFSFTLFAFLLAEGVNNTTDRWLYLRRFIVFTALSELAYDFYRFKTYWNIKGQSVMVTLLISLIIMLICDYFKRRFKNSVVNIALIIGLTYGGIRLADFVSAEFGMYGILLSMLFYAAYELTYEKLFELALLIYYAYSQELSTAFTVSLRGLQYQIPIVICAIFAAVITWFYDGRRGKNSIGLKIFFYMIYPLFLIIFHFI